MSVFKGATRIAAMTMAASAAMVIAIGCGYGFQNSHNPLAEKEGIRKIYVSPVVNDSYDVGVENVVYNALLKSLVSHGRVTLVFNPQEADATLNTIVRGASYSGGGVTTGSPTNPLPKAVSSQYVATLACSFNLIRRAPAPGQKGVVWTGDFARTRPFASAVQANPIANQTTSLINDSEFDRTLVDLADLMMADVHESMLALF